MRSRLASVIAKGASKTFLINIGGLLLSVVLQVVLARSMSLEDYGLFTFIYTWMMIAMIPLKTGWDVTLVRWVAIYSSQNDWAKVKGILMRSNQSVLLLSILAFVVFWTIWNAFSISVSRDVLLSVFAASFTVPFLALTSLRQSTLQAFKAVARANLSEKIIRPTVQAGLVIATVALLSRKIRAQEAMVTFFIATLFSFIIGAWLQREILKQKISKIIATFDTKNWLQGSFPLMLISAMYLLLSQMDIVMIGSLIGTDSAGIYGVAVKIASISSFGIVAINTIAAPIISELNAASDKTGIQKTCFLTATAGAAISSGVAVFLFLFGKPVLAVFGEEYISAFTPLIILSVSYLINAMAGQTGTVMTMTGRANSLGKVLGLTVLFKVIANLFLIPQFHLNGAACSTVFSTLFWNTCMIAIIRKTVGINPSIFGFLPVRLNVRP